MSSAQTSPPPPSLFENGPRKGINIAGWTVTSTKYPILNASDSDAAAAKLTVPLPEICFGHNKLTIENKETGVKLDWDTLSALQAVEQESTVKVAHAAAWARGQANGSSSEVTVQKPYDWTYTSLHLGTVNHASTSTFEPAPPSHPGIPLHLLARQDIPILFFDEVPLFEDELGDNGIAELVVRVRVNSFSVFALSRFFLRVDGVLFRIFDVRLYHEFGSDEIIREVKGREATYQDVKKRLPLDRPDDLKPLTDVNWVSSVMESLATGPPGRPRVLPTCPPAKSMENLSLEDGKKEETVATWKGEGRVLEVLKIKSTEEVSATS
ncbi:hypothetical protein MNV49_006931 [Pseudohyphozyma bogoriensis]|nr:hypothetical protein MNV49_006931 [Pseudohyphozyma bogoriensis]